MGVVWAIATSKGGVLKTSLTTNIAGILCKRSKVLIVDMDPQGNGLLTFGLNPDQSKTTIFDVMLGRADINKATIKVHRNIHVIPANDDLLDLEFEVIPNRSLYKDPMELLKNSLRSVRNKYDYILIDTAPNGLTQGNAFVASDHVIIPFQPELYSMRSLIKTIKRIEMVKKFVNTKLDILGVVATLVDTRTTLHQDIMQECRVYCQTNNIRMFDTVIPRSIRFSSSIRYDKLPATLVDPDHHIVENYFKLFKEVMQVG